MCKPLDRKLTVALCEIIKKNDKRKMTVSFLCRKADIARATFYLHYKSFDDFIESTKVIIIKKIVKEAMILLRCDDKELKHAVKKENFIFDECDYILLDYFTSNENCIEFGSKAFLNAEKIFSETEIPVIMSEKIKSGLHKGYEAFFAGYICMVYFGLSDYDEARFCKEIERCRNLFNLLIMKNNNTI